MFDKLDKIMIKLAVPAVVATFIVVPLGAWLYDGWYSSSRYPAEAHVFTLYWSGEKGITQKRINGWNYWQPNFEKLKKGDLVVHEGDWVVLRLISADVHHGFALPAYGIGTVETVFIKPGDITTVDFVADKVGVFRFYCTIMCGNKAIHDKMESYLTVLPADTSDVRAEASRSMRDAKASGRRLARGKKPRQAGVHPSGALVEFALPGS